MPSTGRSDLHHARLQRRRSAVEQSESLLERGLLGPRVWLRRSYSLPRSSG